jgi:hypothetical protein
MKKVADRFGAPMPEGSAEGGSEKSEGRSSRDILLETDAALGRVGGG